MKVLSGYESIIEKEMKVSSMKVLQIDYNNKIDYDLNMQRAAGKLAVKIVQRIRSIRDVQLLKNQHGGNEMKKRVVSLLLCGAMAVSMLAGCSSSKESEGEVSKSGEESTDGKVTLKVLDNYGGMVEEMIDVYEELHPEINIEYEYVPSDSYYSKFTALNVANELPDVVMTNAQFIGDQVRSDLLVDLTDEVENGQNYEDDAVWGDTFEPTLLENCKATMKAVGSEYENHLFGVPFTMTTVAVIYDKNVYDELKLSVPKTWEEFEKNCEAIKAAGKIPVSMQQQNMDWWPRIFWDQYCRDELEDNRDAFEDGSMDFSSESVVQGLEKFKYMWDQGWFPESGLTGNRETMQQLFVQKELVQVMLQPNYLEYLTENVPDDVELASFALPGVEGIPARCLGGSSSIWSVTKASEHQEEAIEFVKFLTSKTAFSEDYAKFINPGLTNYELSSDNAAMQGYIEAGENGFIPDIYVPSNITTEMQNTFLTDLLPNYLMGTYTIDDVTGQLNQLYEETYLSTLE